MKNVNLNIIIHEDQKSGWFTGQIVEFPAAISQGKTIEELKENLIDALNLLLETQNQELNEFYKDKHTFTRSLQIQ